MDLKRPSSPMYCTMDNAGRNGAIFFNIVGCSNFTEVKSCEVCTVLLDKWLFLCLALEHVKNC